MKHLHLEQPIQSQPQSKLTMEKDESLAPEQSHNTVNTNESPKKNRKLVDSGSIRRARLDDTNHDSQPQRDVCHPKFGSWCDDSSTEQDDDDDDDDDDDESIGGGSFDSNDNIVINMASLTTKCNTYTAFYFSYRVNEENARDSQEEEDDEDDQDNDFGIRISQKRRSDEDLFLRNLRRRQLRFAEQPSVREFEPAPVACRDDMYYSCHQLQKMMDAYHAGRECRLDD